MHMVFEATALLASAVLLGAGPLGLAGITDLVGLAEALGLAEAVGGLPVVTEAGLLVQVAWVKLEFPGTGSTVGMGFPSLVCSFKTFWCLAPRMWAA